MNDRELLELAAKAVGRLSYDGVPDVGPDGDVEWNPLTDDGDALRLAVRLPSLNPQWIIAEAWQAHDDEDGRRAYVRRAITTHAAISGRAMP